MNNSHPINGIPGGDSRPRKSRIRLSPALRMVPLLPSLCMDLLELRKATDIRSPAEVVDDEPLNTSSLCCVDHCRLMPNARGAHDADHGLLAIQSFREVFSRIDSLDHGDAIWKSRS